MKGMTLCLLMALAVTSGWMSAQVSTGKIEGQVSDSTGAMIQKAQVTITDLTQNTTRVLTTGSDGLYSAPDLLPGKYSVEVAATGFQSQSKVGLVLSIGQTISANFALKLGVQTESVEVVSSSQQLIDTATSSMGGLIPEKVVQDLPLNGRSFTNLIPLVAGAQPAAEGAGAGLYDIDGGRSAGNGWLIDGADVTTPSADPVRLLPNLEGIGEFQVLTNNFSAEYGRSIGGIINAHLKTGSSDLHGSLFEYFENEILNATPAFSPSKTPYKFNQYGGSIGGPILKKKLFFFGDYQGERARSSSPYRTTIPLAGQTTPTAGFYDYSADCAANGGTFRGGLCSALGGQIFNPFDASRAFFPNNHIPASLADPTGALMLSLMPAPNCTPGSTTCPASNYITSVKAPENKDSADAHFDYSFTGKDRLSFGLVFIDYSLDYSPLFGPRAGGTFNLVTLNNSQIERLYTLNYTHIFSSNAVNELVLAFTRDLNDGGPTAGMQYESSIAGVGGLNTSSTDTQTTGFPLIYMVPSGTNIGGGLGGPFNQHHNIPQLADNFSFVKGRNQFKTGFLGRFREFNEMQSVASRGMYYFYAWETSYYLTGGDQFASALLGVPIDAERQLVPHEFGQRIKEFGTYFQDDLKLNKRLTLNLGVRWDLYNPATEAHNRLANFDPATVKMVLPGNGVSASTLDTNYKNIGPHLGFAYALTADGKTSLRGGYGIAYLPLATQGVGTTTDRLNQNSPFAYSIGPNLYIENALGLPTPGTLLSDGLPAAPPADPAIPALGAQVVYIPKSQPTPYVQQWNLNIQRTLPGDFLLDVAYVGTAGVHLTGQTNLNQYAPGTSAAASPISAHVSVVDSLLNVEQSNYHAMQAKLEHRFSSGIGLMASYTFSRSIDDGSVTTQATGASSSEPQNAFDFSAERGPSDFNATHRAVIGYLYELPFGKGKRILSTENSFVNGVIGGWQFNGITALQSGMPFTPVTSGGDAAIGAGTAGAVRPNKIGNPYGGTTASGAKFRQSSSSWFNPAAYSLPVKAFGNAGRNSLTGPSLVNFDFSTFKTFAITERYKMQFRSEFFNVFNHTNLGLPNSQVDASSGGANPGQILSTVTGPRQVQFALKMLF